MENMVGTNDKFWKDKNIFITDVIFFIEFTLKRKNNQPKNSADCFLDSDNLNFFIL